MAAPVRLELTTLGLTGANENAFNPFIHKGFRHFQNLWNPPLFTLLSAVFLFLRSLFRAASFFFYKKSIPLLSWPLHLFCQKTIDILKKTWYNKSTTKARPQNGQPWLIIENDCRGCNLSAVVFYCNIDFTLCHAERNYVAFFQQSRKKCNKIKPHKITSFIGKCQPPQEFAPVA